MKKLYQEPQTADIAVEPQTLLSASPGGLGFGGFLNGEGG